MSSKIYAQRGKVAILAGLNWSTLLKTGKGRPAEIRTLAGEAEASKIVVVENTARASVGLYAPAESDIDDVEEGAPKLVKAKILHSLAALFAAKVGGANAVLALSLPITGSISQAVVIVVDSGVPLLDQVKSTEEAQSLAMSYAGGGMGMTYDLFTDDLESFPAGETIDIEELWALCSKTTQLVARPANVMALIVTLIVVISIAGGGYAYFESKKVQERKERARLAALANPTPKYEAALAAQINSFGMNRDVAQAVLVRMKAQPLWVDGWLLSKVDCNLQLANCITTYERAGGTTDKLILARKPYGEEISGESTNNVVKMIFKVEMPASGVPARGMLPTMEESIDGSTPILQVWENASIKAGVGSDGYKIWPIVPGIDVNSVQKDVVVKSRPMSVKTTPGLISEVVATAPSNFWWSGISFDVKVSGKAVDSLTAELKGFSYVR